MGFKVDFRAKKHQDLLVDLLDHRDKFYVLTRKVHHQSFLATFHSLLALEFTAEEQLCGVFRAHVPLGQIELDALAYPYWSVRELLDITSRTTHVYDSKTVRTFYNVLQFYGTLKIIFFHFSIKSFCTP